MTPQEFTTERIALALYARAVSKPFPVNEDPPDWEAIAKECVSKAQEVTPYLLKELGLLPKESQ